jgi:hypothetical protein
MSYGYREIKMNSRGFEYLTQPTLLENESQVMAYAYTKLYMLENSLRGFIERSLRATYGELWTDLCNSNEVIKIATEKKEKEGGKLGIIFYTDFPHLRRLIINNWESVFKSVFKKQDTIVSRLGELETIRHSIAHTRMLSNDNILELELFYKVILKMIMTK